MYINGILPSKSCNIALTVMFTIVHFIQAIVKFEECIASQEEWKQFHHLCYWELMWCHAFKMEWAKAAKYADKLCEESKWSKVTTII